MTERILDKLDEMSADLTEIKERLAVLETKEDSSKNTWKLFSWVLTFGVSVSALVISLYK